MNPLLKVASNNLRENSKVLEIDCGTGKFINKLVRLKPNLGRVVAIDLYRKPENLDSKIEFIQQGIEDLKIDDNFDLVIMKQVFEHLKDPLGTIKKVKSILNEHGKILIGAPN